MTKQQRTIRRAQLQLCQHTTSSRAALAAEVHFSVVNEPRSVSSRAGLAIVALAVAMTGLTGCERVAPPKPLEQLTTQERAGHNAFITNCSQCHNDRKTGALHGPSLLGVYKKPYLPSGAPANDDRIANVIQHGRGMMPALGNQVAPDDITDILAYLKTL